MWIRLDTGKLGSNVHARYFMSAATLFKCDNLFSRPRNRFSRSLVSCATLWHIFGTGPTPAASTRSLHSRLSSFRVICVLIGPRHRVIVHLTEMTLRHHYDVNERRVSILAAREGYPGPCSLFSTARHHQLFHRQLQRDICITDETTKSPMSHSFPWHSDASLPLIWLTILLLSAKAQYFLFKYI